MALLQRAALVLALCLAGAANASASTAPIVRLIGTGAPAVFQGSGIPALQASFSYVEALSADAGNYDLVFTDPLDNRVVAFSGGNVGVLAGDGTAGTSANGTSITSAVVPRPEAVSACCIFPQYSYYVSDRDTNGSHIRQFNTEFEPNIFNGSQGADVPKDFSYSHQDGYTYVAMYGASSVHTVEGGAVAGPGFGPLQHDDPLATIVNHPTSVSVSPTTGGTLIFSSIWDPDTGSVLKVENAGTAEDTIDRVAGSGTTTGPLGDGGPAVEADLANPSSVLYLKDGGFLIYDAGHARIRRVWPGAPDEAIITTIAGDGTAGLAEPGTPANIAPLVTTGTTVSGIDLRPADLELWGADLVMSQGPYGVIQLIPATAITGGPPALTTSRSADFTLASWDDGANYECKLDSGSFGTCHSYENVADGVHTFQARAITNGGNDADPTPASRTWTVDGTPPAEFGLGSPGAGVTADPQPTFTWDQTTDATTSVARYELWVDGAKTGDVACCSVQAPTMFHDGAHRWQIRAVDTAGNVRAGEERPFTVNSPPAATFTIAPQRALTGRNVTFDATSSSDVNGSPVRYEWDLDGNGSHETDGGGSATTSTSYPKPQTITIGLRVTDNDGLTSTASGPLVVTAPPPVGGQLGVSINDGAQYTNDPDVTVFAVWPTFASDALVSNDGGFKTAKSFPVAEKIPWKLDSSGPERLPKTIYVRFTAGSQVSETHQDDIILDQTPPKVLSASLSQGAKGVSAAAARKVTLKLRAKDNVSGVSGVQVTSNKRKPGKVLKFKAKLKVKSVPTLFVRVRDRAKNFSSWRKAKR
jgi:hypothetical protein